MNKQVVLRDFEYKVHVEAITQVYQRYVAVSLVGLSARESPSQSPKWIVPEADPSLSVLKENQLSSPWLQDTCYLKSRMRTTKGGCQGFVRREECR